MSWVYLWPSCGRLWPTYYILFSFLCYFIASCVYFTFKWPFDHFIVYCGLMSFIAIHLLQVHLSEANFLFVSLCWSCITHLGQFRPSFRFLHSLSILFLSPSQLGTCPLLSMPSVALSPRLSSFYSCIRASTCLSFVYSLHLLLIDTSSYILTEFRTVLYHSLSTFFHIFLRPLLGLPSLTGFCYVMCLFTLCCVYYLLACFTYLSSAVCFSLTFVLIITHATFCLSSEGRHSQQRRRGLHLQRCIVSRPSLRRHHSDRVGGGSRQGVISPLPPPEGRNRRRRGGGQAETTASGSWWPYCWWVLGGFGVAAGPCFC